MIRKTYTGTDGRKWARVTKAQAKWYFENPENEVVEDWSLPIYLDDLGLETYTPPTDGTEPEYLYHDSAIYVKGLMVSSHDHPMPFEHCIDCDPRKDYEWGDCVSMWEQRLYSSSDYLDFWIAD